MATMPSYVSTVAVTGTAPPINPRSDGLLRALLYPIDLDVFRREHWLKRPLALTGAGDARLAPLRRVLLGGDAADPSVDESALASNVSYVSTQKFSYDEMGYDIDEYMYYLVKLSSLTVEVDPV